MWHAWKTGSQAHPRHQKKQHSTRSLARCSLIIDRLTAWECESTSTTKKQRNHRTGQQSCRFPLCQHARQGRQRIRAYTPPPNMPLISKPALLELGFIPLGLFERKLTRKRSTQARKQLSFQPLTRRIFFFHPTHRSLSPSLTPPERNQDGGSTPGASGRPVVGGCALGGQVPELNPWKTMCSRGI